MGGREAEGEEEREEGRQKGRREGRKKVERKEAREGERKEKEKGRGREDGEVKNQLVRYNVRTAPSNIQCICSKSYLVVCDMQFSVCVVFRVSFHSHLHRDSTIGLSTEGLLWPVLHTALLERGGEGWGLSPETHLGSHDWKLACKYSLNTSAHTIREGC